MVADRNRWFGNSIAFLPSGELYSDIDDNHPSEELHTTRIVGWDPDTGAERFSVVVGKAEKKVLCGRPFARGTRIITGHNGYLAKIWALPSGKLESSVGVLGKPDSWVDSVCGSPDGSRFATSIFGENLRIIESKTKKVLRDIPLRTTGHEKAMGFSPDGETFYYGGSSKERGYGVPDQDVIAVDVGTGKIRAVLSGHQKPVSVLTISEDGTRMVTGSDDTSVKVWDLQGIR